MNRKELTEIINHNGTVAGICLDKNDNVIVINTKRFGFAEFYEIPGGIIDEEESAESAIKREIKEETGFDIKNVKELSRFYTSVGITNELVTIFLCEIEESKASGEYDILRFSVEELKNLIESDKITDIKTIQAFNLLEKMSLKNSKNLDNEYSKILSIWSIQDSLLQSYRSIFLSSQSVLFSISVFIATSKEPLFMFFIFPIGLYLLYLMFKLTRKRGMGVWYCQLHILKIENNEYNQSKDFMTEFKEFMTAKYKKNRNEIENSNYSKILLKDSIRKSMDFKISIIFLILWLALSIVTLVNTVF